MRRADDNRYPEASAALFHRGAVGVHVILNPPRQNTYCFLSHKDKAEEPLRHLEVIVHRAKCVCCALALRAL